MPLMQKGHHFVTVTGSVLSRSSTGNGQIVVSFRNEDGDSIDAFLSCTEAAWQYTEAKLRTLGYDVDEHDLDIRPLNHGPESPIVGVETEIDVKEELYNGERKLKVDWIGPRTGQAAMAEADEDLFAVELRKRLIAKKGAPKAASKPAVRASSTPY